MTHKEVKVGDVVYLSGRYKSIKGRWVPIPFGSPRRIKVSHIGDLFGVSGETLSKINREGKPKWCGMPYTAHAGWYHRTKEEAIQAILARKRDAARRLLEII